jgi:hypothetical protein
VNSFIDEILNVPTSYISELLLNEYHFNKINNVYFRGNSDSLIYLCSHIDTYNKKMYGNLEDEIYPLDIINDGNKIYLNEKRKVVLGGDDRCGVYILLNLLEYSDKFFFFMIDNEEIGESKRINIFDKNLFENKIIITVDTISNILIPYKYDDNFLKLLKYFFKDFKITDKRKNRVSILDYIKFNFRGFNIGCGFYNEHTNKEYIIFEEVLNTLNSLRKFALNFLHVKNY